MMIDFLYFGCYCIVFKFGVGVMGDVFFVEDLQIDCQLVIKMVKLYGLVEEVEVCKQCMLVEVCVVGCIVYLYVVIFFDVGEDGGMVYFVFEFVVGQDFFV